jgi:hypothetical protein
MINPARRCGKAGYVAAWPLSLQSRRGKRELSHHAHYTFASQRVHQPHICSMLLHGSLSRPGDAAIDAKRSGPRDRRV